MGEAGQVEIPLTEAAHFNQLAPYDLSLRLSQSSALVLSAYSMHVRRNQASKNALAFSAGMMHLLCHRAI